MTRVIVVCSGKGGVGKTTLVSNLSSALSQLGQKVLAIDANLTTPNLGLHLGLHLVPKTIHSVLKRRAKLSDAIYPHPLGFKVLPASMSIHELTGTDVGRLGEITHSLLGKFDYVILDCAAGLGREAISAMSAADEILMVTNPDMPALTDALRTSKVAQDANKKIIGIIVNRRKGKYHELRRDEIEDIVGVPVIAEIPEDQNIPKSVTVRTPVVNYDPKSPASIEIRRIAHKLTEIPFNEKSRGMGIFERVARWVVG